MATVCGKLNKSIVRDCANPLQEGTRDTAYLINFEDVEAIVKASGSNKITDITLKSGTKAYKIGGSKNSIKPKSTLIKKTYTNMYDHSVGLVLFDVSQDVKDHLDAGKDGKYIVICENYFRSNDGSTAFEVYGAGVGMEVDLTERDPNNADLSGAIQFNLMTITNKESNIAPYFFDTDLATTRAKLEALTV
jgi:hypothetical protein